MSKVTIDELLWDCKDSARQDEVAEIIATAIVPRKIVEMIIERCERSANFHNQDTDNYVRGRRWAFDDIHIYAEYLLKQFEEEEE